jgi:hypothetical protein
MNSIKESLQIDIWSLIIIDGVTNLLNTCAYEHFKTFLGCIVFLLIE